MDWIGLLPTMTEYNESSFIQLKQVSDAQASILDLVLFPGFTHISTTVQEHLAIDLNLYVPVLCILGLLVFVCRHIYEGMLA